MKEIRKEITTEQIVYEITKEELEKIKRDERVNGRYDIIRYLIFTMQHYRYELNVGGMMKFIKELIQFLGGETNVIKNTFRYSFDDYVLKYR